MNGFNPLRWDCEKRGCFNVERRPKIEIFSDCFPRNISFGDIDGIVEINSRGLILEWKTDTKEPTMGQRIMYERLTKSCPLSVILAVGSAKTMEVSHMGFFHKGKQTELKEANLDHVKQAIRKWVKMAI